MATKPEDDEVLLEMEVYINQTLGDDLYVLQYPLRAPWNPYPADTKKAEFKVKKKSTTKYNKIEIHQDK